MLSNIHLSLYFQSKELQQPMELDDGDSDGGLTAGPARASTRAVRPRGAGAGYNWVQGGT